MRTKKRPAPFPSDPGPKSKKICLDEATAAKPIKKRSQPVTAPALAATEESDFDDDDIGSFDDEDELDDGAEEDGDEGVGDDEDLGEEDLMDEEGASSSKPAATASKGPNVARESHKAQKLLTEQRKATKPHFSLLTEAKRLWALARQKSHKTTPAERQKRVRDLMAIIRGHVKDIVFKHDASRIVQTVVKYGGQNERNEIALELKGNYKDLAQSKYSRFLVTKLIRFCPLHRAPILLEFQNHVLRLLLHREATSVLADAFELYANAYERTILLRDFYGKEAILFGDADKEQARKGLKGFLEGVEGERRKRLLKSLKENLVTIYNNQDKGAVTHAIVHRALLEYMNALHDVPEELEREKLQRDIFETCQEALAGMVHTKDGSRVVREFLALGTAKDRKQILKFLKPHVERMCLDDEAQLVLFTALDVIDDTKLASKSLVAEMTAAAPKLYGSPQGRRSLMYLLVPRTRRHFTPAQIAALAEMDKWRMRTSKKDADVRESEVRKYASDSLISWVEQNALSLMKEPGGSLVVAEVMLFADGDKSAAIQALLKGVSSPYPPTDLAAGPHPIDLPHASRICKTLLQGGHFNHKTRTVERAPGWDTGAFSEEFVRVVGEDVSVGMCVRGEGNGAFVIAELCAALVREEEGQNLTAARQEVRRWFGEEKMKAVQDGPAKGKKVLLESLKAL